MTIDFMKVQTQKRPVWNQSAIQFKNSRLPGKGVNRSRSGGSCQVNIYCGEYQRCGGCAGNPRQFERLSDDEIRYVMANTDQPELMGAALKKFIKKKVAQVKKAVKKMPKGLKIAAAFLAPTTALTALTTKASVKAAKLATSKKERVKTANQLKAAKKKVVANIKKLPKPLRIAAGIALAPLMPATTASILTTGATVKAVKLATSKKERVKVANQIKAAKKKVIANIKKLPKPLRIAAGIALAPLMPATMTTLLAAAPIAATGFAAKKAAQKVQQVQAARKAAVAKSAALPKEVQEPEEQEAAVVPAAIKEQVARGETTTAPMTTDEDGQPATGITAAEPKKTNMLLPLAALAAMIPLFMRGE